MGFHTFDAALELIKLRVRERIEKVSIPGGFKRGVTAAAPRHDRFVNGVLALPERRPPDDVGDQFIERGLKVFKLARREQVQAGPQPRAGDGQQGNHTAAP